MTCLHAGSEKGLDPEQVPCARNFTIRAPTSEQRRIVAHLDALQAKADALRALQSETAAELDALLPSVLNQAFAGKL